ncbi:MAG TPA: serine/threonine-protein kinase [Polyangiaceae bacterium]|jgi:serine/threonine-protein kinase|nr:serine/threonine-protein kinase [Polyangiaceae bacterium]
MDERELPTGIGRYRVVRLLGRGAMGRVLLARDPVLDRDVAVKLLRDDLTLPPEQRDALLERMRQEARASARVTHPNIVGLYDMGEDVELGLFLVFEYADGTTLKERLTRGALGPEATAKLVREIGDALSTAHEAGVLHRDIKPENIMLTRTGGKIADFGIARVPDSTLTRDGGLLGTPAYSAPESIKSGEFSPASDQFSMAATFYEALSATRAFPGEDAVAVAARITTDEVAAIAQACGLDPHVDGVLLRALSKDPAERFPSARHLGEALAEALERRTRSAQPTLPDQHRKHVRIDDGRGVRTLFGGVALGALLGAASLQLTSGLREQGPEQASEALASPGRSDAVAYLAESPRTPRARPSAARRSAGAPSAVASHRRTIEDAGAAQADAGAEPEEPGNEP